VFKVYLEQELTIATFAATAIFYDTAVASQKSKQKKKNQTKKCRQPGSHTKPILFG